MKLSEALWCLRWVYVFVVTQIATPNANHDTNVASMQIESESQLLWESYGEGSLRISIVMIQHTPTNGADVYHTIRRTVKFDFGKPNSYLEVYTVAIKKNVIECCAVNSNPILLP